MIVYRTTAANGYEIVNCVSYEDQQVLDFDGSSRKEGWQPPHVQRVRPTKRSGNKPADLPSRVDELIMRRPAMEALRDVLDAYGEVLPLATDDGVELFVHNVCVVLDALDKERTEFHPVPETTIVWVQKPVFIESAIGDVEMFRVPEDPLRVYYTERFVQRVKTLKLKGTDFTPVWSSDGTLLNSKSK
jgi:hypothetical protein